MSLRGRLLVAVGAVALVALVAADVTTYSLLRSFLLQRIDQTLDTTASSIDRMLAGPPARSSAGSAHSSAGNQPSSRGPGSLASLAPGTFVQLREADGVTIIPSVAQSAIVPGGKSYTPKLPAKFALRFNPNRDGPPRYFTVSSIQAHGPQFRVRVDPEGGRELIVATPLGDSIATLHRLLAVELVVTLVALTAASLLGWWLVTVGLRPLRTMERSADAIAAGEFNERVAGESSRTEVGRLARALNVMLERIQGAFAERDATENALRASEERMRRFVADASHELRTPLAAVSAYAELFGRGAERNEADLHRVIGGIRHESGRMGNLVEELLLLARLDEGRPITIEPVDLVSLSVEAMQTAQTVGADWPITLEVDEPVEALGERDALRRVLDNLLLNVRTHTPEGTGATITLTRLGDLAVIEVADNGPGFAADQAEELFARFFRGDSSRSRAHGGAGLGLAIVGAIVAAHGGRVSAHLGPHGGGAVFTICLPAA